ncbi:MAG: hypothetical protein V4580_15315 [Bacteroidota bacterium]
MKKIILSAVVLFGFQTYSQNTIPTTTCTGTLKINDSLNVNRGITATGDITSGGEIIAADTMRAQKDVIVDGNAKIAGDLMIGGKSSFEQDLSVKKSLLFGGGNEFSYIPSTSSTRPTFFLGSTSSKVQPYDYVCPNPNINTSLQFLNNGSFISRVPLGSGSSQTNSSLSFYSAPWDGSGIIEVEGVANTGMGENGLLINYFCGRNTKINVNWDLSTAPIKDGGTVFMGAKVDLQSSLKIGWTQTGAIDLNTSIEINQNGNNANGVKVQTWNVGVKAYSILRNDGKNTFVVYGDGRTRIGTGQPKAGGAADNAMLSVDGLILAKEIKVAIANTHWADYVFDKDYKLMPLRQVEAYVIKHKHLPEVQSASEVENNGIDLVNINATLLKKIEELTLYLIEQNKRVEKLEQDNLILLSRK